LPYPPDGEFVRMGEVQRYAFNLDCHSYPSLSGMDACHARPSIARIRTVKEAQSYLIQDEPGGGHGFSYKMSLER